MVAACRIDQRGSSQSLAKHPPTLTTLWWSHAARVNAATSDVPSSYFICALVVITDPGYVHSSNDQGRTGPSKDRPEGHLSSSHPASGAPRRSCVLPCTCIIFYPRIRCLSIAVSVVILAIVMQRRHTLVTHSWVSRPYSLLQVRAPRALLCCHSFMTHSWVPRPYAATEQRALLCCQSFMGHSWVPRPYALLQATEQQALLCCQSFMGPTAIFTVASDRAASIVVPSTLTGGVPGRRFLHVYPRIQGEWQSPHRVGSRFPSLGCGCRPSSCRLVLAPLEAR